MTGPSKRHRSAAFTIPIGYETGAVYLFGATDRPLRLQKLVE